MHVTPVLQELHWLPVKFRIHFKSLLLTFNALNGMAPAYISDLINVRKHACYSFRSLTSGILLQHPIWKMKRFFCDRSFSVSPPTLWNALPACLHNIAWFYFYVGLKTCLFKLAFNL